MALGGRNVGWDNTSPGANDGAGLGDDEIRSLKTSMQSALDSEHQWSETGGSGTGLHRPGTGRAFHDLQSNLSAGGQSGRGFFASDTSRFFMVGTVASRVTNYIGGPSSIEQAAATGSRQHIWAEESGALGPSVSRTQFSSEYSGIPTVQVSAFSDNLNSNTVLVINLSDVTVGGFQTQPRSITPAVVATASGHTTFWRSLGTRLL